MKDAQPYSDDELAQLRTGLWCATNRHVARLLATVDRLQAELSDAIARHEDETTCTRRVRRAGEGASRSPRAPCRWGKPEGGEVTGQRTRTDLKIANGRLSAEKQERRESSSRPPPRPEERGRELAEAKVR